MGVMRRAESRIGRTFSGFFGRSFKAHVQPAELAAKMVKEMEDRKTVSLSRTYVPNQVTVYLCPEDRAQFSSYEHGLAEELEGHALEFVLHKGYQLDGSARGRVRDRSGSSAGSVRRPGRDGQERGGQHPRCRPAPPPCPRRPLGSPRPLAGAPRRRPAAAASADGGERRPALRSVGGETESIPAATATGLGLARQTVTFRMGSRVQEFAQTRVVIGRGRDVDFHLEDPNASRRHAVVYWEGGRPLPQGPGIDQRQPGERAPCDGRPGAGRRHDHRRGQRDPRQGRLGRAAPARARDAQPHPARREARLPRHPVPLHLLGRALGVARIAVGGGRAPRGRRTRRHGRRRRGSPGSACGRSAVDAGAGARGGTPPPRRSREGGG